MKTETASQVLIIQSFQEEFLDIQNRLTALRRYL